MKNDIIKICPLCHYLGKEGDEFCPYCGVRLISECPKCKTPIKTSFAKYCYICGASFEEIDKDREISNLKRR